MRRGRPAGWLLSPHSFPTGSGVLRESPALPHIVTGPSLGKIRNKTKLDRSSLGICWFQLPLLWNGQWGAVYGSQKGQHHPQKYLHWTYHAFSISEQHWRPLGFQFMHRGLRTRTWAQQLEDTYSLLSRGECDSTVGRDVGPQLCPACSVLQWVKSLHDMASHLWKRYRSQKSHKQWNTEISFLRLWRREVDDNASLWCEIQFPLKFSALFQETGWDASQLHEH